MCAASANESPTGDAPDSLRLGAAGEGGRLSPTGQLLMNFLAAINAAGEDAEETYKRALEALRRKPDEAIIEIARLENSCHAGDYPTRWALIHAAAELRHPAALPFFRSVVLTPIPPERSPDPHSSTVAEETILRTTAVDGVAELARNGDRAAVEALFDFLAVPSISIKRAAVQGLLKVEQGESLRGRIEERLCPEDRFLLDIRPLDVRKAQQIGDPESHLSDPARADKPSTPDLPDRTSRPGGREGAGRASDSPSVDGGTRGSSKERGEE